MSLKKDTYNKLIFKYLNIKIQTKYLCISIYTPKVYIYEFT